MSKPGCGPNVEETKLTLTVCVSVRSTSLNDTVPLSVRLPTPTAALSTAPSVWAVIIGPSLVPSMVITIGWVMVVVPSMIVRL